MTWYRASWATAGLWQRAHVSPPISQSGKRYGFKSVNLTLAVAVAAACDARWPDWVHAGFLLHTLSCRWYPTTRSRSGTISTPRSTPASFTFTFGAMGSGWTWWWMTCCQHATTSWSTFTVRRPMSSGRHCWRKPMPSESCQNEPSCYTAGEFSYGKWAMSRMSHTTAWLAILTCGVIVNIFMIQQSV